MPCLYLYVFSFSRRKKRLPVHSALKLKSGFVNQTHANYFTCTIVSISIVPWFTEAIEWSLGVITPSVFMTAIICSVALIYVWKKKKIKGAGTRKDKHTPTLQNCIICRIRGIPQSGRLIFEKNIQALLTWQETLFCFETHCQVALHQ